MKQFFRFHIILSLILYLLIYTPCFGAVDNTPPTSPVKLVFIHHSTGGNWLADSNTEQPSGGLGIALMNNNYYVSATNYGWGPDSIGDYTDIPNWPAWFTGTDSSSVLLALYAENGQNIDEFGSWSRIASDPGGENVIVMIKSCYPNSDLYGSPTDAPGTSPDDSYTVSNAKAVYNNLLTYFQTRTDKLFIVITAPPQNANEYSGDFQTASQRASNARAFNYWLVNDWLDTYPHKNVAVFDYFNILTGANNHHRWYDNDEQHVTEGINNYTVYPTGDWNSHPNTTGQQKATTEFIDLLNYFYNRWQADLASPIIVQPDLSFEIPDVLYNSTNLFLQFKFHNNQDGKFMWELENYSVIAPTGNAIPVQSDLSFTCSNVLYNSTSIWVKLKFYGDLGGKLIWELDSFGVN